MELKNGEYYFLDYGDGFIIKQNQRLDDQPDKIRGLYMNLNGLNTIVKNPTGWGSLRNIGSRSRLATPEEKHWLNTCIKAGKFISKEKALKTFNNRNYEVYN